MCDFITKSSDEGEKCNGIVYVSLLQPPVEAGFYGDTSRVIGFFTKLSNRDHG